MSNEIIPVQPATPALQSLEVYDRIDNPLEAVKALGHSIFKSGIFGCDRPEQGEILAMQCLTERKSPLELARTYHFIQGQLAIRADALLAKYQALGGQVNWIQRTDEKVVAEFYKPNQKPTPIVADIEEYKKNGTAFKSDGKTLKDNWAKWPRRMLTARAISEGVRLVAPECCFGAYIAEELDGVKKFSKPSQPKFETLSDLLDHHGIDYIVAQNVLKNFGMLSDGQTIFELPDDAAKAILAAPQSFLNSIPPHNL